MSKSVITRAREEAKRLKEVNEPYKKRVYKDRDKRAKRHAYEIFGIESDPQEAELGSPIIFSIEGIELVYVGDWDSYRKDFTFIGRGFMVRERCAGCDRPQLIRVVKTLAQLGQYLEDDPAWECEFCKEKSRDR